MQTGLKIHAGQLPITGEIERDIRERVAGLEEFSTDIISCRVTLDAPIEHHAKGGPYSVQIDIGVPGKVLVVNRQQDENLQVAIGKAFDAMRRQIEDYVRVERGKVKKHEPMPVGRVIRLLPEGFGFLQAPDGHEVYFHRNSVLDAGFDALVEGAEVRFVEELGDEGPQASTVHPLERGAG